MQALQTLKQSTRSQPAWGVTGFFYVRGGLSAGAAWGLNTLWVYLNFTVLHEAAHGNIRGRGQGWRRLETVVGWVGGGPR